MKNSLRWCIGILFSVVLTVIVFWPFFANGHIPIPGSYMMSWYEPWKTDTTVGGVPTLAHKPIGDDVFRQVIPLKQLAIEQIQQGAFPLWNPYNGSGQPLLATIHSAYLNPFSFLMLIENSMQGWGWYVLIQMVLTGLLMYWYAVLMDFTLSASMVAMMVLLLSGFMIIRLEYGVYGYSMAALVALTASVELIFKRQRSGLVLTSGATAFLLYTVQPQIFTYILIFIGVYGMIRLWQQKALFIQFFWSMILGIGLAAPQLLTMFELYLMSNVTTDASRFIFERFLLPWTHVITLVIPNYFGNAATYNWWGQGDFVQTMLSVGLIPTFLASFAFFRIRRHLLVLFLGWSIIITILMTLDCPFTRWFYTLPLPIISTNIPSRMYIITTFCLSVLAGIGYMHFEKEKQRLVPLFRFWVPIVGVLTVTLWLWQFKAPCPPEVTTCRLSAFRNTVLELIVFALFSTFALLFYKRRTLFFSMAVVLLLGIGTYNAQKNLPFSEPKYAMPKHPLFVRLTALVPERVAGIGSAVFATDFATQYRYFDTNYYDPLYIRRYGELVSYVNTGDREKGLTRSDVNIISDATVSAELKARRERFWDLTGTVALVSKKLEVGSQCRPADLLSSHSCALLWEDEHWRVEKRETALPRAYLVTDVRVDPDPDHLLSELFLTKTDIFHTAFTEIPVHNVDIGSIEKGKADIISYDTNKIVMSVYSPVSSLLVLSDTWYPGWKASVAGKETEVYRVNYAFRGITVPKGTYTVLFWYDPVSFRWGVGISGFSLVILLYYLMRKRKDF